MQGLAIILRAFLRAPVELVRHVLLMVYLVLRLLLALLRLLLSGEWKGSSPPKGCEDEIPPIVTRKPDPCIYSQSYLQLQGLPVTWNNPDIFLTETDGTPVGSGDLEADHDYLVHTRIWNASFYPALAVEVRCHVRDWGLSGPWEVVETRPDGTERVVLVNIAPWGNSVAVFAWHTQPAGHFCLRATCSHPDDKNALNNVGQENTRVQQAVPGQSFTVQALLPNIAGRAARVRIAADVYRVEEKDWRFLRDTRVRRLEDDEPVRMLEYERRTATPTRIRRWLLGMVGNEPVNVRYAYVGRAQVWKDQLDAVEPLPEGWNVQVDGVELGEEIEMLPHEPRSVSVDLAIPTTAQAGRSYDVNLNALDEANRLIGGVTLRVEVG